MKKKILVIALCVILLSFSFVFLISCEEKDTVDNSSTLILALGDSIAEGIIGASPLIEREDYAYLSVVGQINGFTYRNRAVSGHKTEHMLKYISKEEDNAYATVSLIKKADVITVSILGNDLLQDNFSQYVFYALETPSSYTKLNAVLAKSYENLKEIVKRLKELNPNAQLIFQTIYNPMYPGATTMGEKDKQRVREMLPDVKEEDFYNIAGLILNRLNGLIFDYLEENPGAYSIMDVNGKFDSLYRADESRLDRLIYGDCIHPSNEGHAIIAGMLQQKLEDLGLADHDYALKNYKDMRKKQLDRLYDGTEVDIKKTKKQIDKASTFDAVTLAFFDAVDGVVPKSISYSKQGGANKTYVEQTARFELSRLKVLGRNFTTFLDENESYVELTPTGDFEISLKLSETAISLANVALYMAAENGGMQLPVGWLEVYINELFPPEGLGDIEAMLDRVKNDTGAYLAGFDFKDETLLRIIRRLKQDEIYDEAFELPSDVAFVAKNSYEIVEIKSEVHETPYKAVYIGEHTKNGEPYFILTMFTDADGVENIRLINEIVSLDITFKAVEVNK